MQRIHIDVDPAEFNILLSGLQELPLKYSAALFNKLLVQKQTQEAAVVSAEKAAKKAAKAEKNHG